MPLYVSWTEIAVRLALTLLSCIVIGFDRGIRGHAAGMRTTILVGLAAAAAMVQTNLLLTLLGKTPGSFVVMDLMRLPLGILTGVGFIGGGAIFRHGDFISGVATAATLWVVTVIGLCYGGGQIGVAAAVTVLTVFTLVVMGQFERRLPREQRATLSVYASNARATLDQLRAAVGAMGYHVKFHRQQQTPDAPLDLICFKVQWRRADTGAPPLDFLEAVQAHYHVVEFNLVEKAPQ